MSRYVKLWLTILSLARLQAIIPRQRMIQSVKALANQWNTRKNACQAAQVSSGSGQEGDKEGQIKQRTAVGAADDSRREDRVTTKGRSTVNTLGNFKFDVMPGEIVSS